MSYSQALMTTYSFGHDNDMGNGTALDWSFKGPTGKQGMLIDIGIHVTETFADDATEAAIEIGNGSDADYYGKLNITDGTTLTTCFNVQDDTDAIIIEALPADTQIEVTVTEGTDSGTAAGKGYGYVSVLWY